PTIVIMGANALKGFLASEQVEREFNGRRINFGMIEPSIKSTQVQFIGRLFRPNVEIYTYAESYLDENGTLNKFVPDNKVLIACKELFSMKYAAVTQMENGEFNTYMGELVPKYDAVDHENVAWLTVTSKPVPVAFDVDAWGVIDVNP
ncbi:MAG: major capsid protein, partial [Candidatus Scatosoma sp.]